MSEIKTQTIPEVIQYLRICANLGDEPRSDNDDRLAYVMPRTLRQVCDEVERLRACQTHDYRQIIEESDRYRMALETIANYSGNVEPALLLKYLAEAALKSSGETAP